MIILLHSAWPWIGLGALLIAIGSITTGVSLRGWLAFLITFPLTLFEQPTITEKKTLDQPLEDTASRNPGCILVIAGLLCVVFGLFRLLA